MTLSDKTKKNCHILICLLEIVVVTQEWLHRFYFHFTQRLGSKTNQLIESISDNNDKMLKVKCEMSELP